MPAQRASAQVVSPSSSDDSSSDGGSSDGCSRDEALRRMAAQLPSDAKREMADHVIDNSGSPEATAAQIRSLYHELVQAKAR